MINRLSLLLSLTLMVAVVPSQAAPELTLCYETQDYQPFLKRISASESTMLGERGMLPDMAILASRELNLKLRFTTTTWKRCIELVRTGKVDGLFAAVYNQERESWAAYPRTNAQLDHQRRLWTVNYRVYSRHDSPLKWDGETFSGVTNGVDAPIAYFTYDRLQQMGVLPARNSLPEKGFRLLALNRLDGYVLEQFTAEHLRSRLKLDGQILAHRAYFASEDLFLVLSHQFVEKEPRISEALWSTLALIRERQGQQLLRQYQAP